MSEYEQELDAVLQEDEAQEEPAVEEAYVDAEPEREPEPEAEPEPEPEAAAEEAEAEVEDNPYGETELQEEEQPAVTEPEQEQEPEQKSEHSGPVWHPADGDGEDGLFQYTPRDATEGGEVAEERASGEAPEETPAEEFVGDAPEEPQAAPSAPASVPPTEPRGSALGSQAPSATHSRAVSRAASTSIRVQSAYPPPQSDPNPPSEHEHEFGPMDDDVLEDPPPPPPMEGEKEVTVNKPSDLQMTLPTQDFQKIIVHGKPREPDRSRKVAFKPPSDQHLPTARLKLFCFDKTSGKPLANVQVFVKTLKDGNPEKGKTISNAFGNRSFSRKDGFVSVKVLAGYPYLITATASGYHDFGHMGEHLLITPKDTEVVQGEVGLVPIRIAVVVTLRELRPVHQPDSMQKDVTGQVNPLFTVPRIDQRFGVAPQKVSFYSSEGVKMDFVATTVEAHHVLVGWPSGLGATADVAECTLGEYSTDTDGHCFFYGPKVGGKRRGLPLRDWTTIDVGRWEYARKYHLRANQESPVHMLFDDFTKQVDYPAHVARYPPRPDASMRLSSPKRKALLGGTAGTTTKTEEDGGRSKEQLLSSFLQSAAEVAAVASAGGSVVDPNEHHVGGADGTRSGAGPAGSRHSRPSGSRGAGDGVVPGEGMDDDDKAEMDAELRAYPENNIHNYLDPGSYKLQMKDPSRLLIFYTYSGDGEAAEINRAQNAVVPFNMPDTDDTFVHPRDGSILRPTQFPVQLYCRARPWFHIAVYDVESLEEVGSRYGLYFTIERITIAGPMGLRTGEAEGLSSSGPGRRKNGGNENDPEVLAYLEKQKEKGKLAHLWAKAEVAEAEAAGTAFKLPTEDSEGEIDPNVYRYKVEEVEVISELLYAGRLGQSKEKMWMTPGEKYRVTVQMRTPFLDYDAVQVRSVNWELEPFVFYAMKKVVLLVGVREKFNQLPMPGTEVVVLIKEPPQPPRPPVVKPEWCETPSAYAQRVIDQLIDYVVQNNRSAAQALGGEGEEDETAKKNGPGVTEVRGFTDSEGLVSFEVPPESRVEVTVVNTIDFEDTDCVKEQLLTSEPEQFVGFQLERITRTAAVVLDSATGDGVAGFQLRGYDITDFVPEVPKEGTRKVRQLLDPDLLDAVETSSLEPFQVETTGPDGATMTPFCRRAGRVIKIEVYDSPRTHLMPSLVMPRGNALYVVTSDKHSVVFKAPSRPKIKVICHDTCTFEEIHGVRFRVMARQIEPPPAVDFMPVSGGGIRSGAGSRLMSRAASAAGSRAGSLAGSRAGSIRQRAGSEDAGGEAVAPVIADSIPEDPEEGEGEHTAGGEHSIGAAGATPPPGSAFSITPGSTPPPGPGPDAVKPPTPQAGTPPPPAGAAMPGALTPPGAPTPPGVPAPSSVPSGPRDTTAIGLLQEQQKETLTRIEELERGWSQLQSQYEAEQSDALLTQKRQLELLVSQLKTALKKQQAQLDLLLRTGDAQGPLELPAPGQAPRDGLLPDKQPVYWDGQERPPLPADGPTNRNAALLGQMDADPAASGLAPGSQVGGDSENLYAVHHPTTSGAGHVGPASSNGDRSDLPPGVPMTGYRRGGMRGTNSSGTGDGMRSYGPGGAAGSQGRGEEDEATLKRRAEEEAMMAVFDPAPEEQEPWGTILWDSVTGLEENENMIIMEDSEVAVQVFPYWPYDTRSQMLKGKAIGHVGPPDFRFYLPRDGDAFRFWVERDAALPDFWDSNGDAKLPYHSLARLQPLAPPHKLLSRPHGEMKLLRTPAFDPNAVREEKPAENPADLFAALMTGTGNGAAPDQGGFGGEGEDGEGGGGGLLPGLEDGEDGQGNPRVNFADVPLTMGEGGGAGGNALVPRLPLGGGGDGGPTDAEALKSALKETEEVRQLHRTVSAIQYDPHDANEDMNDLAWQQLRLSDASYLPLERTRLLQFLTRWGSFPHIQGGHCKACAGNDRAPDTNPVLLASAPPTPRFAGDSPRSGGNTARSDANDAPTLYGGSGPGNRGTLYKSRLLPTIDLAAQWVFDQRPPPKPEVPPHLRRHVPDRFARTHAIVGHSEAVYCKSPFFTWWLPNGGGVHVAMVDGLYRDLIPLLDAVALSVEYMDQHLEKVKKLNEGRGKHGRFLLGHEVVDSFCGGVFIVDVSTAQPFSGISFIIEQLSKTFDYWAQHTPPGSGINPPRFNLLLCSRDVVECWRSSLGYVTEGLLGRLKSWYEDVKQKMPPQPGFNLEKALRTAAGMTKSEVPIFLLCGGLLDTPLNTPTEMSRVLYDMQLACINTQAPMQPVHAIELYPMPQAKVEGGASGLAPPSEAGDEDIGDGAGPRELRPSPPKLGADDAATEVSVEEAAALGSNIFALLIDSLATERLRLLELFREVDKDADRALDWQQLYRLVLRLVPDANPAHIRYIQLLLDRTGDNRVRYKDLAAAVRACARGGITVPLRDRLEVQLVLHKMAIIMLQGKITPNEMFTRYDTDEDGYWSEKEQWNMLKDLFPGLRPAEQQLLFEAFQDVDKNQDGRVSKDEYNRAFSSGGVPGLPGSGMLNNPDHIQRMKDAGELDDFTIMAMKAAEEGKRLARIRSADFPLTAMLVKLAGATRGNHRRLDLGRARAFADPIDLTPLESVRDALNANLQQLVAFEAAYGRQLTIEHANKPDRTRGGSALTADPPSRPSRPRSAGRSRSTRDNSSAGSSNSPSAVASVLYSKAGSSRAPGSNRGDGSPASSRPSSARSRPKSASRAPSARLLEPTASHSAYVAATSRPASAFGSVGGGSQRGSRPNSATRTRPPIPAWAATASASEDPHLRKLAEHEGAGSEHGGSVSMPPIHREPSASSQPWHTPTKEPSLPPPVPSREVSAQRSLLEGLAPQDSEERLSGRQEYRPPSERSMSRPAASYGGRSNHSSRPASAEPSAAFGSAAVIPSGEADGGADEPTGPRSAASSRPSSAPGARRPLSAAGSTAGSLLGGVPPAPGSVAGSWMGDAPPRGPGSVAGSFAGLAPAGGSRAPSVAGSTGYPPLAYGKMPGPPSARRQLAMGSATLGFGDSQDDVASALGAPAADPSVGGGLGGGGSRPGSRPSSAGRSPAQSFGAGGGFRADSIGSRKSNQGWF